MRISSSARTAFPLLALAAVCTLSLTGCRASHTASGTPSGTVSRTVSHTVGTTAHTLGATSTAAGSATAVAGQYTLVQYPDAGFGGLYAQTRAASKSIDMEMYELNDPTEQYALIAAAKRHVAVRVLLDRAFSGYRANAAAYEELSANGVAVKWAPAGYIFHIKVTSFDHAVSDVSSANLTSQYYASTRDAVIIDTNPAQVAAIEETFDNDWTGTNPKDGTVQAAGLVWSPNTGAGTAEDALVAQIAAARSSVYFSSEELADARIYKALAADAARGVTCEIVMTNSSAWSTGFAAVTAAGCVLHVYRNSTKVLYIHEKQIIDDASTGSASVLFGSQNASFTSLTKNREAGLLLTRAQAPQVLADMTATFRKDFAGAPAWTD